MEFNAEEQEEDEEIKEQIQKFGKICPILLSKENVRRVLDSNEEIFLLYTISASKSDRIGLGQLNDKFDSLKILIDFKDITKLPQIENANKKDNLNETSSSSISILINQNVTSLKSSKGDTGSVIWRSSIFLGQKLIYDLNKRSDDENNLISSKALLNANVIELGSGTGILPLILFNYLKSKGSKENNLQWLATDQESLISLLKKNTKNIKNLFTYPLNWNEIGKIQSESFKERVYKEIFSIFSKDKQEEGEEKLELIFAIDCIFNTSLFESFLNTLTFLTKPNKTLVLIICELREFEMMEIFIKSWLNHFGNWIIFSIEFKNLIEIDLFKGSSIWLAWRQK